MSKVEELLERGYSRYAPSPVDGECVTDLYQKRFDDETGKKYFITVKRWDFSKFPNARGLKPSLEYETQLYKKGSHDAVNLSFFDSWNVEDVEEHVEWMFSSGRFDYYEEWD